jgi:hypothetical protein
MTAENDRLAIDDEPPVPILQRALDDPRITAAPVVAVAGEQAHAIAVADNNEPVDPMQARRTGGVTISVST